jgi:hypothetical protein
MWKRCCNIGLGGAEMLLLQEYATFKRRKKEEKGTREES